LHIHIMYNFKKHNFLIFNLISIFIKLIINKYEKLTINININNIPVITVTIKCQILDIILKQWLHHITQRILIIIKYSY
jgi:hypothetical protein